MSSGYIPSRYAGVEGGRTGERRRLVGVLVLAAALLAVICERPATAQPTLLTTTRVASGLTQPLYITHAPGDQARMFIVERTGRIKILNLTTGQVLATPFLNVSTLITTSWLEYGLLGMTFHPDFQENGYFYVNYTPAGATIADTIIVRYRVSDADPNVADPASAKVILRFGYGTRREHRAGWMGFGPDGYLYIVTGDGGENDPDNAAQNLALLRGKVLRLDVNGPDGVPGTDDDDGFLADPNRCYVVPASNPFVGVAGEDEIWAYGLRNPWRASFDRETGDFWIGDVGQSAREEINFQPADHAGGRNYGWRCTEGTFCTGLSGCTCNGPALTRPIHEYGRTVGASVTGGYVYRGCAIPDLRGTYIFAEFQFSKVFSLRYDGSMVTDLRDRTAELAPGGGLTLASVASLGEDAAGEIYLCDYGGEVYKIVPRMTPAPSVVITSHPEPLLACPSGSAWFTVAAEGVGPLAYQWRMNGEAILLVDNPTAQSPTIMIPAVNAEDVGVYDCVVTGACESVTSDAAGLIVCAADVDCGGSVDSVDISAFLTLWLGNVTGGGLEADFNGNGTVASDDISAFLVAWLGAVTEGC